MTNPRDFFKKMVSLFESKSCKEERDPDMDYDDSRGETTELAPKKGAKKDFFHNDKLAKKDQLKAPPKEVNVKESGAEFFRKYSDIIAEAEEVDTTGFTDNDWHFHNMDKNRIEKLRVRLLKVPGFARMVPDEEEQNRIASAVFNLMKKGHSFEAAMTLAQKNPTVGEAEEPQRSADREDDDDDTNSDEEDDLTEGNDERIDSNATQEEAYKLETLLKAQFGSYFRTRRNKDGSITFIQTSGAGGLNTDTNSSVLNPRNLSKVITPTMNAFRQQGWTFTQPVSNEFTISVPGKVGESIQTRIGEGKMDDLADKKKEKEDNDWFGGKDKKTPVKKVAGKKYGGAGQSDAEKEDYYAKKDPESKKKRGRPAKKLKEAKQWRDYIDPDELNQDIIEFLNDNYGGQAWFKGGSYAYKFDTSKPNQMMASDGSVIKIKNFLDVEDYADRYVFDDFAQSDPNYWDEFFRPVKKEIPMGRDGAPEYGSEQGRHELANLRGESKVSKKKMVESIIKELDAHTMQKTEASMMAEYAKFKKTAELDEEVRWDPSNKINKSFGSIDSAASGSIKNQKDRDNAAMAIKRARASNRDTKWSAPMGDPSRRGAASATSLSHGMGGTHQDSGASNIQGTVGKLMARSAGKGKGK